MDAIAIGGVTLRKGTEQRPDWYVPDTTEETITDTRDSHPLADELKEMFDTLNGVGFDTIEGFVCCGSCAEGEATGGRPMASYNEDSLFRLANDDYPDGAYIAYESGVWIDDETTERFVVEAAEQAGLVVSPEPDMGLCVFVGREPVGDLDFDRPEVV